MKTIKIYIGDSDFSDELDERIWKSPEKFVDEHSIVVPPELFSKIFTKERLRLLKALEKNPQSVNELVSMLGRPREAVSRDLNYLNAMGLVNLERSGKERIPTRSAPISITM
ncbi:MAG: ArsR family transcriptional regulator [Candidatus Altiarchaeota archaeon]|nr:ArsR family transcriptional regulator [Candidatus Altiarchaeota archaeon]